MTGLVEAMRSAAQAGIAANLFIPAANKIESQAKALSEAEAKRDLAEHHSNHFARLYKRTDTELAAAEARLAEAMKVIEPFARNVEATSLSAALGHIEREHLLAARAFTNAAKEKTDAVD